MTHERSLLSSTLINATCCIILPCPPPGKLVAAAHPAGAAYYRAANRAPSLRRRHDGRPRRREHPNERPQLQPLPCGANSRYQTVLSPRAGAGSNQKHLARHGRREAERASSDGYRLWVRACGRTRDVSQAVLDVRKALHHGHPRVLPGDTGVANRAGSARRQWETKQIRSGSPVRQLASKEGPHRSGKGSYGRSEANVNARLLRPGAPQGC